MLFGVWTSSSLLPPFHNRILSGTGTGNTQYFVWRVKNTFREQFIDNLCHAALNLRQMVNYIAELLLEVTY
jgi:DNA-directed RNA polymerase III subunit RPC3